jgi:hypothetical protein
MTDKETARREIISRYLNEYRDMSKKDDVLALIISLIDNSIKYSINDLTLFFEGTRSYLEENHEKAIESFLQAIAIDEKYAYPWNGPRYCLSLSAEL